MEFILAVPGRRYSEFAEVLQAMQAKMADASCEVIEETRWGEHRLVIAHDPVTAQVRILANVTDDSGPS